MPRSTVRVVLLQVLATLSLLASLVPVSALADEGTPAALTGKYGDSAAPVVGAALASSDDACSPAEFPAGEQGITFQPDEDFGFVNPVDAPDHNLYLTVDMLPPGSCMVFFPGTFGASTFLVLEGTVEFIAWGRTDVDPVVMAGNEDGDSVSVPAGAPVTLNEGDWVTVDREAEYAYRNPGVSNARIVMAAYEVMAVTANGCAGGCRRR